MEYSNRLFPDWIRNMAGRSGLFVRFLKSLGLYKGLRQVNMPENEIEALAKQSMVLPDYEGNPRVASYEEMLELVREAYFQS